MIKKLTLVVGFGAGYVLGAKAGTARYEQIVTKVNELMGKSASSPEVGTVFGGDSVKQAATQLQPEA